MMYYVFRAWWLMLRGGVQEDFLTRLKYAWMLTWQRETADFIFKAVVLDDPTPQLYPDTLPVAPFTPPGA